MPADEGRNRSIEEADGIKDDSAPLAPAPKKTKRRSKFKNFLFLVLLAAGAVTGLHLSGAIDVRPFLWSVAPKIPYVGDYLKEYFSIPETYTLTVEERRRLELEQWQERLDAKEKELQEKLAQSESLSDDIAERQRKIEEQESDLLARDDNNTEEQGEITPEEEALMKELTNTYQEISPSRSAKIVAELPERLAVDLMKRLPQDARASILGKMEPQKAARITEELANPQNER